MKNPFERFRQIYKDLPIKHKMLLISYFQILIPVIIIGFASCMISEKNYSEKVCRLLIVYNENNRTKAF